MEPETNKKSDPQPLSEAERRILQTYGRMPGEKSLRGRLKKERKYFDSGDFALSATGRTVTDNGAVKTGVDHPQRRSISRPHAPVPEASNVDEDANEKLHDQKSAHSDMVDSPLFQHTDSSEKPVEHSTGPTM